MGHEVRIYSKTQSIETVKEHIELETRISNVYDLIRKSQGWRGINDRGNRLYSECILLDEKDKALFRIYMEKCNTDLDKAIEMALADLDHVRGRIKRIAEEYQGGPDETETTT